MRSIAFLLFFVVSSYCINVAAQDEQLRPKIGLVLSGGGAKGAAHIGVLKVLEKNHIPIDYVVGTSIGSYVGGLYALGYSVDDIERIMLELPWDEGYSDFIPRELLTFENKKLRDRYNLTFRLGYSEGEIKTPSGLLLGQSAGQLLKTSTDVVPTFDNFDHLAIPYRAIASDIATAKVVVLSNGSISQAMRASAAVPGVVDPVNIDGQLLVDGGITNNMPVDVAKTMGADIVIAVDIGSPLLAQKDINNTLDVINQLSTVLTNTTTLQQRNNLTEQDILLRPAIDNLSTTDFSIMPQALVLGEKVALSAKDRLVKLSINAQEYQNYQQNKQHKSRAWFDNFDKAIVAIKYQNISNVSQVIIENKFAIKVGDVVTKEALKSAINSVYSLNEFESVDADFVDLPEGRQLTLTTKKKSWGPDYLHFGFSLQTDFSYKSIIAIDLAYIQHDITPNGGEWRNEAKIGWESMIATEIYQPLDQSQHFFSRARVEYALDKWEPTKTRSELVNEFFQGKLGLGFNYANNGAIELGFVGEIGELDFKEQLVTSVDYDSVGGFLSLDYDNLDSINFPTQGNKFSLNIFLRNDNYDDYDGIESKDNSLEVQFDWRGAFSIRNHAFVGIASFASVDNDSDFTVHVSELGGFLNLSGYQKDALIGAQKAFMAVVYQYDLGKKLFNHSSLPMYLGASIEMGNVWTVNESVKVDDMISSGSLYLGTDTSFGPAVLGFGFASEGENIFFLSIGKNF
ncbi:MAG: patatin-like phospholipase family protein [Colwellia sp.]